MGFHSWIFRAFVIGIRQFVLVRDSPLLLVALLAKDRGTGGFFGRFSPDQSLSRPPFEATKAVAANSRVVVGCLVLFVFVFVFVITSGLL